MGYLRLPRRLTWLLIVMCGCAKENAMTSGYHLLVDEAHYNLSGFEPLIELLTQEGFQVARNRQDFSEESLQESDVLWASDIKAVCFLYLISAQQNLLPLVKIEFH